MGCGLDVLDFLVVCFGVALVCVYVVFGGFCGGAVWVGLFWGGSLGACRLVGMAGLNEDLWF